MYHYILQIYTEKCRKKQEREQHRDNVGEDSLTLAAHSR